MSKINAPRPLCSYPGCFKDMTGVEIVEGLGVSHCRQHKEWALEKAGEAAAKARQTAAASHN